MKPVIYFDNNATTRALPEVIEAMLPYFGEKYGNASSMHSFGGGNKKAVEEARRQLAALINADAPEIIFNAGGTEGDNTAINNAIRSWPEKKHIITSAVEHPAVMEVFKNLAAQGYRVDYIGVDEYGRFNLERFKKVIDRDTALVSVMWANSETGVLFPVEEIAKTAREHGAMCHIDAVQALGKIEVDVRKVDADMVSFSAHKIHGPKGIGALYVKKGTRFLPFMVGGHQEKGRRAGTENVPAIVGFGKAALLAKETLHLYKERVAPLRDMLENGLTAAIEDAKINGDTKNRLPNTTNISFGYIEGESILMHLDGEGICASSGSACTSGSLEPSHVLRAMGVPFQFAHGSVRFSLSKFNTKEEVQKVLEVMPPIVSRLRQISPFERPQTACGNKENQS
ncbi:MAG: cysteine desulfurase NifS [Elusimicrobiota bacterium]|jgi:cysteine desulfurase|nr:cysteine desulfurase NifS [Elusimicrobiota bacterium]